METTITVKEQQAKALAEKAGKMGVSIEVQALRDKIAIIEFAISELECAQFGNYLPLKHTFADGIYVREIFIPKGEFLVGRIHRFKHPNFVLKGDVSVLTEEGARRIKAPCSMISPSGTKRVVYAHEDTIWVTVHKAEEKSVDELENEILCKDYEELMPDYAKKYIDVQGEII